MSKVTLTPRGASALELLDRTVTDSSGILLDSEGNDELLPVIGFDEDYATGGRRTRSSAQNASKQGQIVVFADDEATFAARETALQEAIAALDANGGTLGYETSEQSVTWELEAAHVTQVPYDAAMFAAFISRWVFTYTARPFGRLAAVQALASTAVSVPVKALLLDEIPGSAPALLRVEITETASKNRDHVELAVEENVDPDALLPILYTKTDLVVSGFAGTRSTRTGAYDSTGSGTNTVVTATLLSVTQALCAITGVHLGRWRIKARCYGVGTGPIWVRLAWRQGPGNFNRLPWRQVKIASDWSEVDLGVIQIPEPELDGNSWEGYVEAYGQTVGDALDLNYLEILPAQREILKLRAPFRPSLATTATARDSFNQSAGTLSGKTADSGQTWAGAGDADVFSVNATEHTAERTAVSDAQWVGRYATLPASLVNCAVFADVLRTTTPNQLSQGILVRYTDVNNWLALLAVGGKYIRLFKRVAGAATQIFSINLGGSTPLPVAVWHSLRLTVDSGGNWRAEYAPQGAGWRTVKSGSDSVLATGGALAAGYPGIYDEAQDATACTRRYDNFAAFGLAASPHVLYSGKSLVADHEHAIAEPPLGTVWGEAPAPTGKYLTVAPACISGRSRLIVKTRRNDSDEGVDEGVEDGFTVAADVTPGVLVRG